MKIIFNNLKKNMNNKNKKQLKDSLIFNIKNKIINMINKTKNNNNKLTYKHYLLLTLMILIGVLSLKLNINENNKIDKESYNTYSLNDFKDAESVQANTILEKKDTNYSTAVSSISTDIVNSNDITNEKELSVQDSNTKYKMPVNGDIVKKYSKEELILSETLGMWMTHDGIDIEADEGTNVVAILNGTVQSIYQDALYGTTIIINHDNGYTSVYCNLQEDVKVQKGEKVKQGQTIGNVGKTAIIEVQDNPHIHLEILKDGINIDPANIGLK